MANSSGGQVVAFTYDLALNVFYTRQENPLLIKMMMMTLVVTLYGSGNGQ